MARKCLNYFPSPKGTSNCAQSQGRIETGVAEIFFSLILLVISEIQICFNWRINNKFFDKFMFC